jgi:hypothetical protein
MTYEALKIDGQRCMYRIKTEHNGMPVEFNVACANDESEIDELVSFHLAYLDAPAPTYPTQN